MSFSPTAPANNCIYIRSYACMYVQTQSIKRKRHTQRTHTHTHLTAPNLCGEKGALRFSVAFPARFLLFSALTHVDDELKMKTVRTLHATLIKRRCCCCCGALPPLSLVAHNRCKYNFLVLAVLSRCILTGPTDSWMKLLFPKTTTVSTRRCS